MDPLSDIFGTLRLQGRMYFGETSVHRARVAQLSGWAQAS